MKVCFFLNKHKVCLMWVCVPAGLTITLELVQNLFIVKDRDPAQTRFNKHEGFLSHETGMSGIKQG